MCTFNSCSMADNMFERRSQWFNHELQMHRREWCCNEDQHEAFQDKDLFLEHLKHAHSELNLPTALEGIISLFERPLSISSTPCPFCKNDETKGLSMKNLEKHLAGHMEMLALFALPRSNGSDEKTSVDSGQRVHISSSSEHSSLRQLQDTSPPSTLRGHSDDDASGAPSVGPPSHKIRDNVSPTFGSTSLLDMNLTPEGCSVTSNPSAPKHKKASVGPETTDSRSIPRHLSFVFRIESLSPNYEVFPRWTTSTGAWAPPDRQEAYQSTFGTFWRWQGGRVTQIPYSDPCLRAGLRPYKVASLFSQDPDTPHLLVVPFDVRTRNVSDYQRGWLPITFDHHPISTSSGARDYYSSVSATGSESHLAAPGQGFWMPQLLPQWYNYRAPPNSRARVHAGLIGNLPILLALAAFSVPAVNLAEAMKSIQPGAWAPHRHPYPSGRTFKSILFSDFFADLIRHD